MFTPLAVVALTLGIAALYVFVPRFVLWRNRRRLAAACREQKAIALTFDDGPGRFLTPLVVQRLAEAGVPATFFLVGSNVRGNEGAVAELHERGHEVGTHGDRHVHHLRSLPWTGMLDTRSAWETVGAVAGRDGRQIPYRPPFGKMNLLSLLHVVWERTPIAMWTHDGSDTRPDVCLSPEGLAWSLRAAGGGVVLLHDFDRSTREPEADVLAKLDAVLALRSEGFRFVRVGELLGGSGAEASRPLPASAHGRGSASATGSASGDAAAGAARDAGELEPAQQRQG